MKYLLKTNLLRKTFKFLNYKVNFANNRKLSDFSGDKILTTSKLQKIARI